MPQKAYYLNVIIHQAITFIPRLGNVSCFKFFSEVLIPSIRWFSACRK